jgi:hypothetical protein
MNIFERVLASVILLVANQAFAQLPSEFAKLACKPSAHDAPQLTVEKGRDIWTLSVEKDGVKSIILRAAVPISNAQYATETGYVVYFLANAKYPKQSGWVLHRLKDGKSVQVAEAQLAPTSACVTPDGRTLDYVTQSLQAVQIDLSPAYERFRYWDDPAPKDHVLVPANGG